MEDSMNFDGVNKVSDEIDSSSLVDNIIYTSNLNICLGVSLRNNKSIERAIIQEGAKRIQHYAFKDCEKLKEVSLPSTLKELGGHSFENCVNLKSIRIPQGVTTISSYTFFGCKNLEKVILPESVANIEKFAFAGCSSLERLVFFPKVKFLPVNAIEDCPNLDVYSAFLTLGLDKDKTVEDYNANCNFSMYYSKDLYNMVNDLRENLSDIFSKEEIEEIIQNEVYNLSFL